MLRRLWAEGGSASKIGRELGLGKNQVIGLVHRMKLPSRPSPIRRPLPSTHKIGFVDTPWHRDRMTACCWPLHAEREPPRYCGAATENEKSPYCAAHAQRAYVRNAA